MPEDTDIYYALEHPAGPGYGLSKAGRHCDTTINHKGAQMMQEPLDGTVLITGASSGIGKACAQALARVGARLILVARRGERLKALADSLTRLEADVFTLELDVQSSENVEGAIRGNRTGSG